MTRSKHISLKTIAFLLMTGPAFAGGMKIKIDTNSLDDFARDAQYDWSGFYTGGSINYTAQFRGTGQLTDEGYGALQPKGQGPKGSIYAGYNFQVNNFIIGAEADLSYGRNHDNRSMTGTYQNQSLPLYLNFKQSMSYALKSRLGYAFNDLMIFGTLGISSSYIKNKGHIIANNKLYDEYVSHAESGYVIGLGLEYAINDNMIARSEYIYSNFERNNPWSRYQIRMGLQEHEIRTGLAYKF